MKLYVDDLREAPPGWVLVRTITEAQRILSTQEVEAVSLDHDVMHTIQRKSPTIPIGTISDDDFEEVVDIANSGIAVPVACPENYSAIAWFLRLMPECIRPPKIYTHTANPAGHQAICDILKSEGIEVSRLTESQW